MKLSRNQLSCWSVYQVIVVSWGTVQHSSFGVETLWSLSIFKTSLHWLMETWSTWIKTENSWRIDPWWATSAWAHDFSSYHLCERSGHRFSLQNQCEFGDTLSVTSFAHLGVPVESPDSGHSSQHEEWWKWIYSREHPQSEWSIPSKNVHGIIAIRSFLALQAILRELITFVSAWAHRICLRTPISQSHFSFGAQTKSNPLLSLLWYDTPQPLARCSHLSGFSGQGNLQLHHV